MEVFCGRFEEERRGGTEIGITIRISSLSREHKEFFRFFRSQQERIFGHFTGTRSSSRPAVGEAGRDEDLVADLTSTLFMISDSRAALFM